MLAAVLASSALMVEARRLPQTHSDAKVVSKLAQILDQSGYTYRKAADNVWVVTFNGNSLKEIPVLVTSTDDLIIMGVVLAEKKSMRMTPELMHTLLKLPNNMDRIKIGLDNDEDLFVRIEVPSRFFDLQEFKTDMAQVAAASDQVHAAIKPFRVP
jgi:hypothetical protein